MSSHDADAAFANAPHIPGGAAYPARWAAAAAAFRARAGGQEGLEYGPDPRHRFDLFTPAAGAPRGLMVFVHGGFWRAFGRQDWSHLGAGALARGWAVALPSYRLAPQARLAEMTAEMARLALPAMAAQVAGPLVLAGHSAGGHLVARMLCADVALPAPLAARLARVVPISPLGDLRPLVQARALNADLCLDAPEAAAESPALCPRAPDRAGVGVHVWVGGAERPAFLEQARGLAQAWACPLTIAPERHHFDVIAPLEDPNSPLCEALLGGL